jgi:epoxyqueuosine reductase
VCSGPALAAPTFRVCPERSEGSACPFADLKVSATALGWNLVCGRVIMQPMLAGRTIKERALELGFDLAGIAPLDVWKDLEFSRQWVEKGFNGEMHYLENPKRFEPLLVLPSAKSVICVGMVYNAPLPYSTEVAGAASAPRAWISRYAWGRDYHEIMRAKIEQLRAAIKESAPDVETRVFVDTGPLVERAFARFSGIGWMGKNTCIINQEKGSWLFLGIILCSLELASDLPAPDRCGSCTACLEACPTGALIEPYAMDASRCISYLTIELRGTIPSEFRAKMGNNVFGCDICQDVCPWNSSRQSSVFSFQQTPSGHSQSSDARKVTSAAVTRIPQFHPMIVELTERRVPQGPDPDQETADYAERTLGSSGFSLFNPSLEALGSINEDDFRLNFAYSPVKRAKYRGWLRNLAVAMGNSGDVRFVPWLERIARHPDPIIREHAAWALDRLRGE